VQSKSLYLNEVLKTHAIYSHHVIFRQKNFDYWFIQKGGVYAVFMFDEDDGQISLTNAIEEVIGLILMDLVRLNKIPSNLTISNLRFFAYGTDEEFCEPKVSINSDFSFPKNFPGFSSKDMILCTVKRWESISGSDNSWRTVFLLG
jgi:hypothetical protein